MALCPICKARKSEADYRPFCSRRCADVDLQRWFSGAYVLPGEPAPDAPFPDDSDGDAPPDRD